MAVGFDPADHGTTRGYGQGCKCPACRAANAAYQREWRRRRRGGVPATYRRWTEEECVAALRGYAERAGRVPSWSEWKPAPEDCPSVEALRDKFGSWSNALVAAGLEARPRGDSVADRAALDRETAILAARKEAGATLTALAAEAGITPQALGRRITRWVWERG